VTTPPTKPARRSSAAGESCLNQNVVHPTSTTSSHYTTPSPPQHPHSHGKGLISFSLSVFTAISVTFRFYSKKYVCVNYSVYIIYIILTVLYNNGCGFHVNVCGISCQFYKIHGIKFIHVDVYTLMEKIAEIIEFDNKIVEIRN